MAYHELENLLELQSGSIAAILALNSDDLYVKRGVRPRMTVIRRSRRAFKVREVYAPREELKEIQRKIAQAIAARFEPHPIAHAYRGGRGIITNAQTHLGAKMMLHVDLVDFFGSIKEPMVTRALHCVLVGVTPENVAVIAKLCCRDGRLPQGSPASPILSNLVCFPLDVRLANLSRSLGCSVGRYSDDVSISSAAPHFPSELGVKRNGRVELGQPLLSVIKECGFEINWSKVRFETRRSGLKVTGLNVGNRVTVSRRFRANIRAALHRWAKEGAENAARRCCSARSVDGFINSLKGSIGFVGQVLGRENSSYRRLADELEMLVGRDLP